MPQLGLGTEIGRVSGGAYDSDALAYFARAGIASGTQTPSSYDNAASFNGTNQFLSIPSNSSLNLSGTSFTICAWVNPIPAGSGLKTIVAKSGSYALSVGEFNSVFFDFVDGSGTQRLQNLYAYGATASRWNFLCVSVDAGVISFSVNGINIASQGGVVQGPTTFSGALVNTTNPLTINGNSSVGTPYAGAIGPCAIWKRALSPSEVTALFNSGAGRTYASLDSGLLTNLVSWWALNQNSVTADSAPTGNNLTNNGSVTAPNIGPIVTTTQNSRQLINNFVKGIKSLGLWNSMVCWPLRASQNASTTLTVRSLGGLGTFDGTIAGVSASNWLSNGLNLPNNTGFISFPSMADFSSGITAGSVNTINSLSSQNRALSIEVVGGQSGGFWSPFADGRIYWDCLDATGGRLSVLSGAAAGTYYMWSGSSNGTSIYLNASQLATGGPTIGLSTTFNQIQFGRTQTTSAFNGNVSFIYILRSGLTNSQIASFYSFYRSTLGIGLALP
jgi:hypothetical protein